MIVGLTGASGIVGQFVTNRLVHDGTRVVAISRNVTSLFGTRPQTVEWRKADMSNADQLVDALSGCDSLVHSAFAHVPGKYRGGEGDDPEAFWRVNFFGTMNVLNVARQVGIERTIFVSSRAVFGDYSPYGSVATPIVDQERVFPDTHYGALKASIESLQLQYADIGMCSIRPTGVYGLIEPRSATKWWDLVRTSTSSADGSALSTRPRTEVHGDDVASAISIMLNADASSVCGRTFNCSDISVNEALIWCVASRLASGTSDPLNDPLPAVPAAHHEMSSEGLLQLGWKPGGMEKLVTTVQKILAEQSEP